MTNRLDWRGTIGNTAPDQSYRIARLIANPDED